MERTTRFELATLTLARFLAVCDDFVCLTRDDTRQRLKSHPRSEGQNHTGEGRTVRYESVRTDTLSTTLGDTTSAADR